MGISGAGFGGGLSGLSDTISYFVELTSYILILQKKKETPNNFTAKKRIGRLDNKNNKEYHFC